MKRQFFSGNTLEQAVLAAAREFGIEPDRVAYTVRDKRHGFLKIRRRVVIEVDSEAPERAEKTALPPTPAPKAASRSRTAHEPTRGEPVSDVEDLEDEDLEDEDLEDEDLEDEDLEDEDLEDEDLEDEEGLDEFEDDEDAEFEDDEGEDDDEDEEPPQDATEAVERAVREVLRFLRLESEIEVEESEDGIFEVELSGPGSEVLVEKEGRLLHAMDHLLPRLVRGLFGEAVPCKVDCGGYRETREEELWDLAEDIAEEVAEDGRSRRLKPMGPADRRVVHMALADHPDVETESEGEGYFKRVRVSLIED